MNKFKSFPEKKEPEVTSCKTIRVGAVIPGTTREMYYCGDDNAECRYVMPIGFDYICKHPDCKSFLDSEKNEPGTVPVKPRHGRTAPKRRP
jgi:hypothetical protein